MYIFFIFCRLPVKFLITSFWVWAITYLTMFLAKVKQSYKNKIAFQKQKHRFDELMSKTRSLDSKEDIQPSTSLDQEERQNNQNLPMPPSLILVTEASKRLENVSCNETDQNAENVESVEVNNVDSRPEVLEISPKKIQLNNQAANPEVYGFKVVFFSFIAMWFMNVPIWVFYLFYSDNFSELFIFIQLNSLPHLTASLILPPVTLTIDKKKRNFCREMISDIFT